MARPRQIYSFTDDGYPEAADYANNYVEQAERDLRQSSFVDDFEVERPLWAWVRRVSEAFGVHPR